MNTHSTIIALLLLPCVAGFAVSQEKSTHKSIHQIESEFHSNRTVPHLPEVPIPADGYWRPLGKNTVLAKRVYGWYPYWLSSSAYQALDYVSLSHIAYFSYETDITTGGYLSVHDWNSTPLIAYAHDRGVKVTLTVTNFGYDDNDALLSDTVKQNTMIQNLVTLLKSRNGDGVNFDLESVRGTQRANLVAFMRRATSRIKAEIPSAEISMASPAVDWSGGWDFAQLSQICDYLVVMGYDYYWSGSSTAGPVAPLAGESYSVTRSVNTYLTAGVPPERLLLGVPWFGYDWPVTSSARKATTTGTGTSRTYVLAEQMAASSGKLFDETTKTAWFSYLQGSTWRQVWYDDSLSLACKYDLVNTRSLGGIGIWALGYDGARKQIWYGIRSAFTSAGVETGNESVPQKAMLLQNYPNPFNATTKLGYTVGVVGLPAGQAGGQWLVTSSHVRLVVYDLLGREVTVLVDEAKPAGNYQSTWNASSCPSGVYISRLTVDGRTQSHRMVLLR
jgi:spore germination protein YaaH